MGLKIGGSLGKLIKKVSSQKIGGVSLGGALSSLNPLTLARHAVKNPDQFKSDLSAGSRNAAVLTPVLGKLNPIVPGQGGVPAPIGDLSGDIAPPSMGDRFRSLIPDSIDDWIDVAEGAGNVYDRYTTGKREGEVYDRGKSDWDARAPLRQAGIAGMLGSTRPDNSALFADPMNPQGRYRRVNVGSRG